MPVPYTSKLEKACHRSGWSLVQPLLSSSYTGFGHGSLRRDTSELDELFAYLRQHRNAEKFCIVGHSTGCQNAVHYLKHASDGDSASKVVAVALQSPVSDREHAMMDGSYVANLDIARKLKSEGREDECMPRSAFWAPITASRYLDLHERGGADDFFSSDFSDDELADRLKHVSEGAAGRRRRVVVAFSGSDEYVPSSVDSRQLTNRLVRALNAGREGGDEGGRNAVAEPLYLPAANHNLSNDEQSLDEFVGAVEKLLSKSVDCS